MQKWEVESLLTTNEMTESSSNDPIGSEMLTSSEALLMANEMSRAGKVDNFIDQNSYQINDSLAAAGDNHLPTTIDSMTDSGNEFLDSPNATSTSGDNGTDSQPPQEVFDKDLLRQSISALVDKSELPMNSLVRQVCFNTESPTPSTPLSTNNEKPPVYQLNIVDSVAAGGGAANNSTGGLSPCQSDTNVFYSACTSPHTPASTPLSGAPPEVLEEQAQGFQGPVSSLMTDSNLSFISTDQLEDEQEEEVVDEVARAQQLIEMSAYLEESITWSARLSLEERREMSPRFCARNDNIWELFQGERNYLNLLLAMHQVYYQHYPPGFGQADEMFPCLRELIPSHSSLLESLLHLHFASSPDLVVEGLGPLLIQRFGGAHFDVLARMYGRILFSQARMKERLVIFKRHPVFLQYLKRSEKHPAVQRKTLDDCYTIITQRWTKVETLLVSIIKNTVDDPDELASLEQSKSLVRQILRSAEAILGRYQNARQLRLYAETLETRGGEGETAETIRREMLRVDQELLHHGRLKLEARRDGKVKYISLHAVLLKDMFFLLQEIPDSTNKGATKFQLYKEESFPTVLRFGESYGYFREHVGRAQSKFGFFIILERPAPAMACFYCDTPDDRSRWRNLLFEGFARWRNTSQATAERSYEEREAEIQTRWKRTREYLAQLQEMDDLLASDWERRSALLAAWTLRWDSDDMLGGPASCSQDSTSSVKDTYLPGTSAGGGGENTTGGVVEELDQWMQALQDGMSRVKFAAATTESSVNLTRSASTVEERRRPPVLIVRKNESFSGYDSPSRDQRTSFSGSDTNSSAKSESKPKRDYRRLSSNLKNLFNIGSSHQHQRHHQKAGGKAGSGSPGDYHHQTSDECSEEGETMIEVAANQLLLANEDTASVSGGSIGGNGAGELRFSLELVHKASQHICMVSTSLHSKIVELEAQVRRLEDERAALADLRRTVTPASSGSSSQSGPGPEDGLPASTASLAVSGASGGQSTFAGGGGGEESSTSGPPGGLQGTDMRQENEKLRQRFAEFEREKTRWEKELRQQRASLERGREDLLMTKNRVERDQASLVKEREAQEENVRNLHQQVAFFSEQLGMQLDLDRELGVSAFSSAMIVHQRSHSDDVTTEGTAAAAAAAASTLPHSSNRGSSSFYSSATVPRGKPPSGPPAHRSASSVGASSSNGGGEGSAPTQRRFMSLLQQHHRVQDKPKAAFSSPVTHGSIDNLMTASTSSTPAAPTPPPPPAPLRKRHFFGSLSHMAASPPATPISGTDLPETPRPHTFYTDTGTLTSASTNNHRHSTPMPGPLQRAISLGSLLLPRKQTPVSPAPDSCKPEKTSGGPASFLRMMTGGGAGRKSDAPQVPKIPGGARKPQKTTSFFSARS